METFLAPIFVGIVVGGLTSYLGLRVQHRQEHDRWTRDTRLRVYSTFYRTLTLSHEGARKALTEAYVELTLVATESAVDSAEVLWNLRLADEPLGDNPDWHKARGKFIDAARKDMGFPPRRPVTAPAKSE